MQQPEQRLSACSDAAQLYTAARCSVPAVQAALQPCGQTMGDAAGRRPAAAPTAGRGCGGCGRHGRGSGPVAARPPPLTPSPPLPVSSLFPSLPQYEADSAPALAIQATIAKTEARFDKYANQGLLCGTDGLPHLIADPGLALRYGHAGDVLVRAQGAGLGLAPSIASRAGRLAAACGRRV